VRTWDYSVRCFYGKYAEPPRIPGSLAIETVHVGTHSRDMEIEAGKSRKDIGRIDVRDLQSDGPWTTVYEEELP